MFQIVKTCGKDSVIPVIMATDALGAGIDTTGNSGKSFLNNLYRVQYPVPYVSCNSFEFFILKYDHCCDSVSGSGWFRNFSLDPE